MHETGLSKEAEEMLEKWEDPQYMAGFNAGCETFQATDTDLDKANQRITYQENCIKLLNDNIERLEDIIGDLKQPWYRKLWNKLPRISINIERGA